jgi:hypothetical protein
MLFVKSFKIKAKLIVSQEKQKTTPKMGIRSKSPIEEEIPTMSMLKYATKKHDYSRSPKQVRVP